MPNFAGGNRNENKLWYTNGKVKIWINVSQDRQEITTSTTTDRL